MKSSTRSGGKISSTSVEGSEWESEARAQQLPKLLGTLRRLGLLASLHGPARPKGLLAGETAITGEHKAWSWYSGSFYHYFRRYPQLLARQDKPDASSGCNSRPGKG